MSEPDNLATPLPRKIRAGEFSPSGLTLETALDESVALPWSGIFFLFLGRVETKPVAPEKPSGPKLNVIRAGAAMAGGPIGTAIYDLSAKKQRPVGVPADSFFLLDVYPAAENRPFRFDSIGTNFKKFLKEEAGYSSDANFAAFVRKLAPHAADALDESAAQFVEKGKRVAPVFPSRDAFAWRSFELFRKKRS